MIFKSASTLYFLKTKEELLDILPSLDATIASYDEQVEFGRLDILRTSRARDLVVEPQEPSMISLPTDVLTVPEMGSKLTSDLSEIKAVLLYGYNFDVNVDDENKDDLTLADTEASGHVYYDYVATSQILSSVTKPVELSVDRDINQRNYLASEKTNVTKIDKLLGIKIERVKRIMTAKENLVDVRESVTSAIFIHENISHKESKSMTRQEVEGWLRGYRNANNPSL